MKVKRFIYIYDLQDDFLIEKQEISHLNINTLKNYVSYGNDEKLLYCYEILDGDKLCLFLINNGMSFDFKKFSYFLHAEQAE